MNTKEAAQELLDKGFIAMLDQCKTHEKLVGMGFALESRKGIYATDATHLALLTPTQFICAQQLAKTEEIGFDEVPKAQKAHMDKLVMIGWACMDKHGSAWKSTEKLVKALRCWKEAKSANVAYKAASEVSSKSINAARFTAAQEAARAAQEAWEAACAAWEAAKAAAEEAEARVGEAWEAAREAWMAAWESKS